MKRVFLIAVCAQAVVECFWSSAPLYVRLILISLILYSGITLTARAWKGEIR